MTGADSNRCERADSPFGNTTTTSQSGSDRRIEWQRAFGMVTVSVG
jgi:hypothetical protein